MNMNRTAHMRAVTKDKQHARDFYAPQDPLIGCSSEQRQGRRSRSRQQLRQSCFFIQVGAEDLQGANCLQLLEVRVLGLVICDGRDHKLQRSDSWYISQKIEPATGVKGDRRVIEPGFLTVVFTAYPFSSSILISAEPMYPLPPVTHAVFFLSDDADIAGDLVPASGVCLQGEGGSLTSTPELELI